MSNLNFYDSLKQLTKDRLNMIDVAMKVDDNNRVWPIPTKVAVANFVLEQIPTTK